MTDKVQKIKDWISKEQDGLMDAQGNFENPSDEGAFHILTTLDYYIDSLQEEPVSEKLEEAAWLYYDKNRLPIPPELDLHKEFIDFFKAGAKWQKDKIMANAINIEVSLTMSVPSICISLPLGVNVGDKVKVIIIKED